MKFDKFFWVAFPAVMWHALWGEIGELVELPENIHWYGAFALLFVMYLKALIVWASEHPE